MQGKQEQVGKGGAGGGGNTHKSAKGHRPPPPLPDFLHSAPLAAQSAKDIQQK